MQDIACPGGEFAFTSLICSQQEFVFRQQHSADIINVVTSTMAFTPALQTWGTCCDRLDSQHLSAQILPKGNR